MKISINILIRYSSVFMLLLLVNSFIYPKLTYLYFITSLIVLLFQFMGRKKISKIDLILLIFIIMLPIIPIVTKFDLDYTALYVFFVFSVFVGYALSMLKPITSSVLCSIPWLLALVSFSVFYSKGYIAEDFFPRNSRNFVSITLLSAVCSYYVLLKKWDTSLYIVVLATLSLFYCMYAVGRSGIITFSIIYITIIGHYFIKVMGKIKNQKMRYTLIFYFSLILLICIVSIYRELYDLGVFNRIISRGLHDYSRESILKEYVQEIGVNSLFIGVSYSELSLMGKFRNNLHNSYLSMHSAFGLLYGLFFVFLSILMVVVSLKKKQFIYFTLILSLLARAWSDIQIFSGRLDWFFIFSFFYIAKEYLSLRNNKREFLCKKI